MGVAGIQSHHLSYVYQMPFLRHIYADRLVCPLLLGLLPLAFCSSAAACPELKTCSTTVLKELHCGHWIPKKCQLRR
jgi:hypothetical protein